LVIAPGAPGWPTAGGCPAAGGCPTAPGSPGGGGGCCPGAKFVAGGCCPGARFVAGGFCAAAAGFVGARVAGLVPPVAGGACAGGGACASKTNANASEQRQVVISVFIVEARVDDRFDFGAGSPLSQRTCSGVQQNFSFFSAILFAPRAHLSFEISTLQGCKQVFQIAFPKNFQRCEAEKFCAFATVLRRRGQSPISASNLSPG